MDYFFSTGFIDLML